jgi:hypothetical protein
VSSRYSVVDIRSNGTDRDKFLWGALAPPHRAHYETNAERQCKRGVGPLLDGFFDCVHKSVSHIPHRIGRFARRRVKVFLRVLVGSATLSGEKVYDLLVSLPTLSRMAVKSSCRLSTVAEAFFVNLVVGSVVSIGSSPFEIGSFPDNAAKERKVARNLRDTLEPIRGQDIVALARIAMKLTTIVALMTLLAAGEALSQSSGEPATPKAQGAGSGTEPGGMGSTGETGGTADKVATPPTSYRSQVVTGLDLKGPPRAE